MRSSFLVCSLIGGLAFAHNFSAERLAAKMDQYSLIIPHARTYIRHCAPYYATGYESCTVHNAGPYFIQLAVRSPLLAQLRIQLVVGHGYGPHAFRRYGSPALLAFLMAVTNSEKGGQRLFKDLSAHMFGTSAQWQDVRVTQIFRPHRYLWRAEVISMKGG